MPELIVGTDTEEGLATVVRSLVASGVTVTLRAEMDRTEPVEPLEIPAEDLATSSAIVAAIAEITRPAEWFTPKQLEEPQRWTTVTADGEVWGHTALFGECHIGYPGRCLTPEMITKGGFDYANGIGHVVTADGAQVGTSPIAIKGGHAHKDWDWKRAQAHYDDPSTVVADVVYGTDEHGITFHGGIRPGATPEMIYALRASGVSGDWREIEGMTRFLASCCVNSGGYPKMKARVQGDRVLSLVAAGGPPEPDPTLSCCGPIEIVEEADEGLVASITSLSERWERIDAGYQTEVLASLAERLTDA